MTNTGANRPGAAPIVAAVRREFPADPEAFRAAITPGTVEAVAEVDVTGLELPAGVHVQRLTIRHVVHGGPESSVIVWGDRTYRACPRCNEPVAVEVVDCPAFKNPNDGQVWSTSHQHGCGGWLEVAWGELGGDASEAEIMAMVVEVAEWRAERIGEEKVRIRKRLLRELAEAMDAPDLDDALTGSEVQPGVFMADNGHPAAWDYHPTDEDATLIVDPDDVAKWRKEQAAGHAD